MDRYMTQRGEPLMDAEDELFEVAERILPGIGIDILPNGTPIPSSDRKIPPDPTPGSGSGGSADITKVLSALQSAKMTPECRVRANSIITGLVSGKMPNADDGAWIQQVVMASQGLAEFPPECVPGVPWYVWAAGGAGVLLTGWLIYSATKKDGKRRKK